MADEKQSQYRVVLHPDSHPPKGKLRNEYSAVIIHHLICEALVIRSIFGTN